MFRVQYEKYTKIDTKEQKSTALELLEQLFIKPGNMSNKSQFNFFTFLVFS